MYTLSENAINDIVIDERIKDDELHEYSIVDREDFLDNLLDMMAGCGHDSRGQMNRNMMKEDYRMISKWDHEYILTSNSSNSYSKEGDSDFEEICAEILKINARLENESETEVCEEVEFTLNELINLDGLESFLDSVEEKIGRGVLTNISYKLSSSSEGSLFVDISAEVFSE